MAPRQIHIQLPNVLASRDDVTGIDVEASNRKHADVLQLAIATRFPDAVIHVHAAMRPPGSESCRVEGVGIDLHTDTLRVLNDIAKQVLVDEASWIVRV